MKMTPQQIATQAAEQIGQYYLKSPYCRELDNPHVSALILSAAAKMVRESGAVPAFERCLEIASDACTSGERPFIPEYDAALLKLRAITSP